MNPRMSIRWGGVFVIGLWISGISGLQAAAVTLDGIEVLASSTLGDDSQMVPVLISDVEMISRLLLVSVHGADWQEKPVDNALRFNARRIAILARLLAAATTQVGERIRSSDRDIIVRNLEMQGGGSLAIDALLRQCGGTRLDLEHWVSTLMLAKKQLEYMGNQVDIPRDADLRIQFDKGDHPFSELPYDDARDAFRQFLHSEQLRTELRIWLNSILSYGNILFSR